jgi:hypothetical protein
MEAMRRREEEILRSEDELRGALLPSAEPVPFEEAAGSVNSTIVPLLADAMPVAHYEDSGQGHHDVVREAIILPNFLSGTDSERDKALLRRADRYGAIDVEEERRIALREQQRLYAIECATREEVRLANQRAKEMMQLEERGQLDEPRISFASHAMTSPRAPTPERVKGSYGKDYEIKPYDVKQYETQEYQIGEYKSVYEPN